MTKNIQTSNYARAFTILLLIILAGCPTVQVTKYPSVPVQQPPAPADDYPAVQVLLNQGGLVQLEARDYYFSKTLIVSVSGTTVQGRGNSTVLHWTPPAAGKVQSCINDRAIAVLCGISFYPPRGVVSPIKAGDTSMQVSDSSGIVPGDWLMVGDWGVLGTYTSVVDWVQVKSVNGDVINFVSPMRITVSTSQPFAPYTSGAGFVRMVNLENVTLQDFSVQIDARPGAPNFPAVGVTGTQGTTFQRLTINDPAGNPFWTYYSKGTTIADNTASGSTVNTEVASSVDFDMHGNTFSGVCLSLDLGTAYFSVASNTFNNCANIGIYSTDNVHDGTITANTIGYVQSANAAVGIYLEGSPNITVSNNSLAGGAGASIGILVRPGSVPGFSWPDTGDVLTNNTIQGFVTPVSSN